MKHTRPKRLALLAALFAVICAGHAEAQTPVPRPDPLPFVQAATSCVHQAGDVPDEWRRTWQRAQLWSLYYGYSLAQTFSRTSGTPPANCAANMGRLQAALASAESAFSAGWRGGNARAIQNARALLGINPHYAQGWCAAVISESIAALRRGEAGLIGLDPATPQGREGIAAAGGEFDALTLFYDQRSLDAQQAGQAGESAARDANFRGSNDFEAYRVSVTAHQDTVLSVVRAASGASDVQAALFEAKRLLLTTELAACRAGRRLGADDF
jgi:hypothetical protein